MPETDAAIDTRIDTITDLSAVREELKRLAKAVRDGVHSSLMATPQRDLRSPAAPLLPERE